MEYLLSKLAKCQPYRFHNLQIYYINEIYTYIMCTLNFKTFVEASVTTPDFWSLAISCCSLRFSLRRCPPAPCLKQKSEVVWVPQGFAGSKRRNRTIYRTTFWSKVARSDLFSRPKNPLILVAFWKGNRFISAKSRLVKLMEFT